MVRGAVLESEALFPYELSERRELALGHFSITWPGEIG